MPERGFRGRILRALPVLALLLAGSLFASPSIIAPDAGERATPPRAAQAAAGLETGAASDSSARVASAHPALPADLLRAESQPPLTGLSGSSYIVMDGARVLFARQSTERRAPASLTKIMTGLLVLERGRLDEMVTVDDSVKTLEGTDSKLVGLLPGDRISVLDLVYGTLLWSGNDAALLLARHFSGSEQAFAQAMNRRAADLGLADTRFANSHGLDARSHYTTAYDMAQLAAYAMQNPAFREIVATQHRDFTVSGDRYFMYNLNGLLQGYEGADGVKIGFTDNAGQTIAASAVRGGRRLIVVVLGSENRFGDAVTLLDLGFGSGGR